MQTQKRVVIPPDNAKKLARIWPGFVNIEKRAKKEVPFILRNVAKPDPEVFDSCLGCGATSIGLKLAGVSRVISNEVDNDLLGIAFLEAAKRNVCIMSSHYDWKRIPPSFNSRFDLVTCLGNSVTCVFGREEQLMVLRNFAGLLNHSGALIIDERNYPRILEGRFHHSGEYVYCGVEKVVCKPVHVSDDLVVMEYKSIETGEAAYIKVYPFKRGELPELLREAGFADIRIFGDYKEQFDPEDVEFFTYVARK